MTVPIHFQKRDYILQSVYEYGFSKSCQQVRLYRYAGGGPP